MKLTPGKWETTPLDAQEARSLLTEIVQTLAARNTGGQLNYPVSNCPRLRRRAALVIGGGVALIFKKPTKRKAGQRAGMTRAKIVDAAVKLWDSAGPEGFTIRKLAL